MTQSLTLRDESAFSPWRWLIAAPNASSAGRLSATTPSSRRPAKPRAKAAWRRSRSRRWRARAGIAAGTVYRYFPSKTELVGALVASAAEREIAAVRRAADAAPGPLSALAAAIATFAARAAARPQARLGDDRRAGRRRHRRGAARLPQGAGRAIRGAAQGGDRRRSSAGDRRGAGGAGADRCADRGAGRAARAGRFGRSAKAREAVQTLTLFALRGLGVVDARARGLVVQVAIPSRSLPPRGSRRANRRGVNSEVGSCGRPPP